MREIKFRAWDTAQKRMVAVTNMEFYDGELGWINTASFDDETNKKTKSIQTISTATTIRFCKAPWVC